ncbi:MAG: SUMF1/EgtB/PvdO family nonheme iron enzyme [Armatimonadota bacterium]
MSMCFPPCRIRRFGLAVLAASLLLPLPTLRAQDLPPGVPPHGVPPGVTVTPGPTNGSAPRNPAVQEVPADTESGDRKLPLESVAPYSSWKHHVADKPEQALVQVRGGGAVATGLVIRCDGFVLVPRAMRDVARNGGLVEVTYRSVDGVGGNGGSMGNANTETGKRSNPPVTVAARYHPGTHASVPYALIKTNGAHAPSLPLLESHNVAPGQPVRLLWLASGANPEVITRPAVIGPAAENKDTFSVAPESDSTAEVPFGAFVVDAASGAVVGMVTQEGTHPAFITLARFQVIAGEVGVAPDRAAVRLGDRPGTLPKNAPPMVWVPGGPVALDGVAAKESSLAFGTTVACTPGFWAAVQPVTNGEYRTWLKGQGLPLPFGWTDQDLLNPVRRADRPACGMFLNEAITYAAAQQSRLPTEVEWRRAAYTTDTAWVEEQNVTWATAAQEVRALLTDISGLVIKAELDALASARAGNYNQSAERRPTSPNTRVNVLVSTTPELEEANERLENYVNIFLGRQDIWGQVHQMDAYRQDVSVFGARNVLINAPELVLSRLNHVTYAAKRYPAVADPDLRVFKAMVLQMGTERSAEREVTLQRLILACLLILTWQGGSARADWAGSILSVGSSTRIQLGESGSVLNSSTTGSSLKSLITRAQGSLVNQTRAGFRCAR